VQRGRSRSIPRTSRLERLSENLAIFDFELSEPEMTEIARLARRDGRIVDYGLFRVTGNGTSNKDRCLLEARQCVAPVAVLAALIPHIMR